MALPSRAVLAQLRPSEPIPTATTTVTSVLLRPRQPRQDASCATVMPTATLITSICVLGMLACAKDRAREAPAPSQTRTATAGAHARGLERAQAMVANARLCEPEGSPTDLEACESACALNHSNSCANWGQLLESTEPERARALYDRACKGGSGIGCESRAHLAARDEQPDAEERFVTARNYHRVHCSQGYARSCVQLAALYDEGLGGAPDARTASEFRLRACKLGHKPSCATTRDR